MLRDLSTAAIAGILLVSAGGAAAAQATSEITQPETIVLIDKILKGHDVDLGKPGPGPGDFFMFVDSLTDPTDGSSVGKVRGRCEFQLQRWFYCEAAAFIGDRGQILVEGFGQFTEELPTFDLAITGGTGEFDNVRGSLHIETLTPHRSRFTFDLIP